MPKVTIDGQEMEVAAGTTILQACLAKGREIPHYCYHDGLSIAGNCRMCLVDVEKQPKLVIGCYTTVAEGMVVHTENEKVKKARAAMMEFFLINHPLDCPICDQAGECRPQDYAVTHGTGKSRYTEPKLALAKAVDIGAHVTLDQERCIQCSRCIRFCDEITKTGELGFFQRGERSQIGIFPGKRLDNPYSGNVVDLCPVGALTLKEFRFQTRVWYLRNTSTICAGCARGCNVVVGTGQQQTMMTTSGQLDDRIKRIVPRVNTDVNDWWICDEGRLSYLREQGSRRPDGAAGGRQGDGVRRGDREGRGAARGRGEGRRARGDRLAASGVGGCLRLEDRARRPGRRPDPRARSLSRGGRRSPHPRRQGRELDRGQADRRDAATSRGREDAPAPRGHARRCGHRGCPRGDAGRLRRPVRDGRLERGRGRDPVGVVVRGGRHVRELRGARAARAPLPPAGGRGPAVLADRARRPRGGGCGGAGVGSESDVLDALAAKVPEYSGITTESLGLLGVGA
jgi:Fe-S-cluster-containing hydrogenase component 2